MSKLINQEELERELRYIVELSNECPAQSMFRSGRVDLAKSILAKYFPEDAQVQETVGAINTVMHGTLRVVQEDNHLFGRIIGTVTACDSSETVYDVVETEEGNVAVRQ